MQNIAIIDYGLGNVKSICSALKSRGFEYEFTRDTDVIMQASGLILPGVGAFKHGMSLLEKAGLDKVIKKFAATGKPLLGICLGMQLLFEKSYEFGEQRGLGIIEGNVEKLALESPAKLPHISWSEIFPVSGVDWTDTILENVPEASDMYFVHSFRGVPTDRDSILAEADYAGTKFCATVKKDNIYGCQFHPEKSAEFGLRIIESFIKLCEGEK